jgi:protein-S-isoprenylcysteine O-methyltransferase Ste14
LLVGLVVHKLLWEVMKRDPASAPAPRTPMSPVKAVKIGALGFLVLQTAFLNAFPIAQQSRGLRRAGLLIYLAGLGVAMLGRLQLGNNWVDLEDSKVLPEHAVVSTGVYRFIRHPIYAGDLLLLAGLQLALNSWLVVGVLAPLLVVVKRTSVEERQLAERLPEYSSYKARTKRFIPLVV